MFMYANFLLQSLNGYSLRLFHATQSDDWDPRGAWDLTNGVPWPVEDAHCISCCGQAILLSTWHVLILFLSFYIYIIFLNIFNICSLNSADFWIIYTLNINICIYIIFPWWLCVVNLCAAAKCETAAVCLAHNFQTCFLLPLLLHTGVPKPL